jgi:two-component system sensor histidine kinase BaeS
MSRSLRTRLTVVFGGLTLLAVALVALVVANILESLLIDLLRQDLEVEAHLIAGLVAPDLARSERAAIQRVLTDLDAQASARVVVVDGRGRLVAATEVEDRSRVGLRSNQTGLARALGGETVATVVGRGRVTAEVLYVAAPVTADGQTIGAVRLAYQLQDIQGTVNRLNLGIAVGTVVVASIVCLLAFVSANAVSAPIRALSRATHALAYGDLQQRVSVSTKDEVGALGEAFNNLAARLADLETARQEMAADVSHELRALSGAMNTAVDALVHGADREAGLRDELMHGLVSHADRLVRLADDLRELGRIEGATLTMHSEPVSLAAVARQAVAEWAGEAARRAVRINLATDDGSVVKGDRDRLVQACGNLIENALKYADTGGWIGVRVTAGAGIHLLEVEDDGPGIPAAELPSIFHRSYRVEGRASQGPGGMGLGLAIVDRIARAHGGEVSVRSDLGHGATFSIQLPALVESAPGSEIASE